MATGVTPKQIWDALEKAGASAVQAAGIMGNMIAESALDPEARNPSGAVGLVQWIPGDHPGVPMPTGRPQADMQAQVNYLASSGGFQAASGTTVAETAGNFSANYERCAGCQPGGASHAARQASAATVAGWASAGDWPATAAGASDTAVLTSASQGQASATCAWAVGVPSAANLIGFGSVTNNICLLSKSQARALLGAGLVVAGVLTTAWGVGVIALFPGVDAALKLQGAGTGRVSAIRKLGRTGP